MNSLDFIIKGCIKEKETHLPVSNLNVRAYDKDMLYDDLLGNATTDEKGEFAINYSEKDFRELFDNKPDIYLSVFDPLRHLVYSTQDSLRWNASEEEFFEIFISRRSLGNFSPSGSKGDVTGKSNVTEKDLNIIFMGRNIFFILILL